MRTVVPAGKVRRTPAGISIASVSRLRGIRSMAIKPPRHFTAEIAEYAEKFQFCPSDLLRGLGVLGGFVARLFRRHRVLLAFERGLQRVPCQCRALHSRRELRDAR